MTFNLIAYLTRLLRFQGSTKTRTTSYPNNCIGVTKSLVGRNQVGRVKIHDIWWSARSYNEELISIGASVRVIGRVGLTLLITTESRSFISTNGRFTNAIRK